MSLQKLYSGLILTLTAFSVAECANVYYRYRLTRCIFSSSNVSDVVYFEGHYFNKYLFTQFDSTLGRYEGFNEYGMKLADFWNNGTVVQKTRVDVDRFCKYNANLFYHSICDKEVKPLVKLSLVKQAGGRHPAVLMCSAYEFYPPHIKVSWLRDGELMTSEVTATMELADGDWYYQIHSELEYTPKSGEKISCVVEHASFHNAMIYDWDPSVPEDERSKIVIGASGLVLGIVIAAAGLIYYKKKSTGRILVPH